MTLADYLREEGREIGILEGIEQGIEQARTELVQNLILAGIDFAVISKVSNLSEEKIRDLEKELKKDGNGEATFS